VAVKLPGEGEAEVLCEGYRVFFGGELYALFVSGAGTSMMGIDLGERASNKERAQAPPLMPLGTRE